MCDQLASDGTAGLVSAFTEKDVLSRRERSGAECSIQGVRTLIGVYTHPTEVRPHRGFHLPLHSSIKTVTAATFLLNRTFHVRRHAACAVFDVVLLFPISGRLRQVQDALDITIPVLPLQLQQRAIRYGRTRRGRAAEG